MLKYLQGLCVLIVLIVSSPVGAAVITTVEWESKPGAPWSYTSGKPNIDCTMPPSPSGGCALKFTYPAGTYATSFGGGRAEYALSGEPDDIYFSAWMRYSPGFVFHPVGQKVNFWILAGGNTGCRNVAQGYNSNTLGGGPQICWGPFGVIYYQNVGSWNQTAHTGEWHWYEMRVKLNTPGGYDGIMQIWIDGDLYMSHTSVAIRAPGDTRGWGAMQHTAEYGGGGSVVPATQYWWVDHTVISTTRIGMPGGVPPVQDTTPPTAPTALGAQ